MRRRRIWTTVMCVIGLELLMARALSADSGPRFQPPFFHKLDGGKVQDAPAEDSMVECSTWLAPVEPESTETVETPGVRTHAKQGRYSRPK
jgi:hypothetical protein